MAVILVGVLLATLALWRQELLQPLEFALYDRFVKQHQVGTHKNSSVVLVGITEEDVRSRDYPLRDRLLARLIQTIRRGGARVVGLDLYRDLPEPRSGMELSALNEVLSQSPNVFVIERLPDNSSRGTQPPAIMLNHPDRIGLTIFLLMRCRLRKCGEDCSLLELVMMENPANRSLWLLP